MLSIEQCREIAEQDLLKIEQSVGERLSLVPEVMELSLVVAFFYQGAAYLESGQSSDRLLGNGPIFGKSCKRCSKAWRYRHVP